MRGILAAFTSARPRLLVSDVDVRAFRLETFFCHFRQRAFRVSSAAAALRFMIRKKMIAEILATIGHDQAAPMLAA